MRNLLNQILFWLKNSAFLSKEFLLHSENAWRAVAAKTDEEIELTTLHFVRFWLIVCALAEFFGFYLKSDEMWFFAILSAFFRALSLLSAWWISLKLIPRLAMRFFQVEMSSREVYLLVSYGLTTVFVIESILSFLSVSFLYVLAMYALFILYNGVSLLLALDENKRGSLTLFLAVWLCFLPLFLEYVFEFIVPNAPL